MMYVCTIIFGSIKDEIESGHPFFLQGTGESVRQRNVLYRSTCEVTRGHGQKLWKRSLGFCADPKLLEMIYLRKRVRKKGWNQLKGVFYLILELDLYLAF